MNQNQLETLTHHAMLVVWGQFAQSIGLIEKIQAVPLHQKTVEHRPQTEVLEFLVAILGGLEHLQDLSRSAHPLDQDQAVAKAVRLSSRRSLAAVGVGRLQWGQPNAFWSHPSRGRANRGRFGADHWPDPG